MSYEVIVNYLFTDHTKLVLKIIDTVNHNAHTCSEHRLFIAF